MNPTCLNPVASPVSASSRPYRSRVYWRIWVEVSEVEPKVTISPAACQVVPEVSRSRSSSTTSVQPSCGEVVGDRGADDPAADDDDAGPLGVLTSSAHATYHHPRRLAQISSIVDMTAMTDSANTSDW